MVNYIPYVAGGGGGGITFAELNTDRLLELVRSMYGDSWAMRLRMLLMQGASITVVRYDPQVEVCPSGHVCSVERRGSSYHFTIDASGVSTADWARAVVGPLPSFEQMIVISAMLDPTVLDVALMLHDSAADKYAISHIYVGADSNDFRLRFDEGFDENVTIIAESVDLSTNVVYPFIYYTDRRRHILQRYQGAELVGEFVFEPDRLMLGCKVKEGYVGTCFYPYIILVYL